jgi:hypothetical protein
VLVAGVVSSCAAVVQGLLHDLLLLLHQGAAAGLLGGLEVVLLENGECTSGLEGEQQCFTLQSFRAPLSSMHAAQPLMLQHVGARTQLKRQMQPNQIVYRCYAKQTHSSQVLLL